MLGETGQWAITEEFSQRLGCGVLTAVALPVWFLVLVFVVPSNLALLVALALFALTTAFALAALRRARRLPRCVRIEDGTLVAEARGGVRRFPLAGLQRVDIGTSLGVWPVRLSFADGSVLRLPRELDDLPGLLAVLRRARPDLVVQDHNPPDGADHNPADGADRPGAARGDGAG
ncbi:MAG: hypothetical protein IT196_09450 [Acidimicrobiales bacterium]|nr:hypothetical protein [Acidimicrobiales bacterium]